MSLRVLIAGCGDLGIALALRLQAAGHAVLALRRDVSRLPPGLPGLAADLSQPQTLVSLADTQPEVLVYCAAADSSDEAAYRSAYVDGLRHVQQALHATPLRHAFFVSSTRVYGQNTGWVDDDTAPQPADARGQLLQEAEQQLAQWPQHTVLRFSGIYGPGRNRLIRLAADPALWPHTNPWTNRIHRDDGAAFIAFLVDALARGETPARSYLVTDNSPAPQHEVLQWLAQQQGVPLPAVAAPEASGKRLRNSRLRASGFPLQYPDYRAGYRALLS